MPLGIDATTRYATNNWKRPIRQSELDSHGPYNTRLNRGLPPTPIGNPGLASIKAAAEAVQAKLPLLRRASRRKSGEHAFSSTDAQFQRDVAKYQAHATDDPAGRVRLAGRALTLAADAQRGLGPSGLATGATSSCRSRRTCSRRP